MGEAGFKSHITQPWEGGNREGIFHYLNYNHDNVALGSKSYLRICSVMS